MAFSNTDVMLWKFLQIIQVLPLGTEQSAAKGFSLGLTKALVWIEVLRFLTSTERSF